MFSQNKQINCLLVVDVDVVVVVFKICLYLQAVAAFIREQRELAVATTPTATNDKN